MRIDTRALRVGNNKEEALEGEKLWTLYYLIDPRDGLVHYIGITKDKDRRLRQHLKGKGISKRQLWINDLIDHNLKPTLRPMAKYWSRVHAEHCECLAIEQAIKDKWPLKNHGVSTTVVN